MEKTKVKIGIVLIVGVILFVNLVMAGFGSTFVPSVDNKPTIITSVGAESDYYIYLQNNEKNDIYMKINILVGEHLKINNIKDKYKVSSDTKSDSFPVLIKIKIPDNSSAGTVYEFTYTVVTGSNNDKGIITFSPVSFEKTIYVSNGHPDWSKLVIIRSNNTDETIDTDDGIIKKLISSLNPNDGTAIKNSNTIYSNIKIFYIKYKYYMIISVVLIAALMIYLYIRYKKRRRIQYYGYE